MELRQEAPLVESTAPAVGLAVAPSPPALPWSIGGFRFYLRVRTRFAFTVLAGLAWAALSAWVATGWVEDLARVLTLPGAVFVIAGIAIIPGYLNVQLVSSLLFDRPRPIVFEQDYPAVTLLVAAYNEEAGIRETLEYARRQDYPGPLEIVVADDGSTDRTRELAAAVAAVDRRVRIVTTGHAGKSEALNAVLETVRTAIVATIDADTLLMPYALKRAVARMLSSPPDTVAVAGSVLVRNSRANTLARVQRAGGWPNKIGEDIVLTWALIRDGGRTIFEPTAIAFTDAPVRLRHFVRQRRRWARGMIEGLREHGGSLLRSRRLHVHAVAANCLFPYLDTVYTIAVPVGIVLALTGNFLIVGPMTVAVLPISLMIALTMYVRQRAVFKTLGLRIRRNLLGFVLYVLVYQLLMSPISVSGYATELVRARRVW